MDPTGLYRVTKQDADLLAQILTECFQRDPLYCSLIPEGRVRRRALPEIFACDAQELLENCQVYADSPALNGILIVSDETKPCNSWKTWAMELYYQLKTHSYLIKEDPSLKTLWNFLRGREYLSEEWAEELPQKNRLHIVYFAVRPAMRGKGIATRLMSALLRYADDRRLAVSLETHSEKNVGMYRHYGFSVFEVLQKHFDLKQYCMVRPSRPALAAG